MQVETLPSSRHRIYRLGLLHLHFVLYDRAFLNSSRAFVLAFFALSPLLVKIEGGGGRMSHPDILPLKGGDPELTDTPKPLTLSLSLAGTTGTGRQRRL